MKDLFGADRPPLRPKLSQWHTPAWLAQRAAAWIPVGARVLEPCAGGGSLVRALKACGHAPEKIMAMEIDSAWVEVLRELHMPGRVVQDDFLLPRSYAPRAFDWVLMNPPYEDNLDLRFVLRALEVAKQVVAIVQSSFEHGVKRDDDLWQHFRVVRRARCVERPQFGGETGGTRDIVVLHIAPRHAPRRMGEVDAVLEERWRRDERPEVP